MFHDSATNHFVVIGVLYELGHADPFLRNVLRNGLPLQTTSAPISTEELDLQHALPDPAAYYTYPGSLTTPLCREDVTWIVLKRWAQLSPSEFETFRHTLGAMISAPLSNSTAASSAKRHADRSAEVLWS